MTRSDDLEPVDRALIDAAAVGLFSERCGIHLAPWQQRTLDQIMVARSRRDGGS